MWVNVFDKKINSGRLNTWNMAPNNSAKMYVVVSQNWSKFIHVSWTDGSLCILSYFSGIFTLLSLNSSWVAANYYWSLVIKCNKLYVSAQLNQIKQILFAIYKGRKWQKMLKFSFTARKRTKGVKSSEIEHKARSPNPYLKSSKVHCYHYHVDIPHILVHYLEWFRTL